MSQAVCALCDLSLPSVSVESSGLHFCCHGCSTVFSILSAKNELEDVRLNPVFLQAVQAGVISNPQLLESLQLKRIAEEKGEKRRWYFEVGGMWCPTCAELIRLVLLQKNGVVLATIDYATDLAVVEYSPMKVSEDELRQLIESFGYSASKLSTEEAKAVPFSLYLRLAVAAFCSVNLMMFAYPIYASFFHDDPESLSSLFAWLSFWMTLPVLLYSAAPIFKKCISALQMGLFGMEALVSIGITSAFLLSSVELWRGSNLVYFDSLSVIVVFVLLGKVMEARAKFSAKEAFLRLSRSIPKRGRKKMPDGSLQFVNVKDICLGDRIVAFAGEKIVLDGVIEKGEGALDESLMTGEALPVFKNVSQKVIGGTVLTNGEIEYCVVEPPETMALQRIIEMVQGDLQNKNSYVRAADKVVKWFVPAVLIIALFTGVIIYLLEGFEPAFLRFLAVLLISCPCAIGIAAPLAEGHLMNALAGLGIIVRNRGVLDKFGRESVYLFDKTGVVTEGRFEVIKGLENLSKEDLEVLSAMCARSNHLIARAISKTILPIQLNEFEVGEVIGKGIWAKKSGHYYQLGSIGWMVESSIRAENAPSLEPATEVYFAKDKALLSTICLGDKVRTDVPDTLKELKGVEKILLSGDGERVVKAVAEDCCFDKAVFSFSPMQKREYVLGLKENGRLVAMVGDGMNDAPSLTAADVGISVVSASDLSIQVSDLLLTTESLKVIPKARELSSKCRVIVKQNLFWAFAYNAVGILLAAFGYLSPIFAAFAMVASSLIVVYNAQRLKLGNRWIS